jgi:hypothetical protein
MAVSSDMRGLTKREYFAAAALQGILAAPHVIDSAGYLRGGVVENAVKIADHLVAELAK